jgi:hypothetical protein
MKKPKRGDLVEIYYDPVTKKYHEGKAKLIKLELDHSYGKIIHQYWTIEFLNYRNREPNTSHEQEQRWVWLE